MKNVMTAGAALLLTTSLAQAGGLDRGSNAYSVLFEEGNYVQLSFSSASPEVSGDYPDPSLGDSTGNMAESYSGAGFALKYAVNDKLDFGLFLNQPYGANAAYEGGFYDGLTADWGSEQLSLVAKYEVAPGISVYGGLRAIRSKAEITIPDQLIRSGVIGQIPAPIAGALPPPGTAPGDVGAFIAGADLGAIPGITAEQVATLTNAIGLATSPLTALDYSATTSSDTQVGYIVGAAYERPEIALRVALTYESGVTHEFESDETLPAVAVGSEGTFEIELPQSVALDFQSGIAADTLAFGSIKWTEWSVWDVRPSLYEAVTGGSVTGLDNDVITYRAGLGRRLSDELSVFGRVTYEKANGGVASRLAPTDGSISYGIGGSYTMDNIEITGGVEYAILGDAEDGTPVDFSDNSALGFGLSVGFSF